MIRYSLVCTSPAGQARKKSGAKAKAGKAAGNPAVASVRTERTAGCGYEFESWFQGSTAFEALQKRGQIVCPACGATGVEKALMAPSVKTTKGKSKPISMPGIDELRPLPSAEPNTQADAAQPTPQQLASLTPQQRAFVDAMRKVRAHVLANSENVGDKFADEARKIHYEEADSRSIHGEASLAEARALAEEGIDVMPLPALPDDRN